MGIALTNPVFAIRIDIYANKDAVYALIDAVYAIMDVVYALINAKYESMNGVYDGINVVPESINDGFESINGSLEGRNGVYVGKKCVALASSRGHNPCRNNHKDEVMALYDNPGALYDSGLFYDDSSSPQLARKRMAKVKLGLQNLNPDELIALANLIKTAMTGNANFTTPNPTLTALGTLITTATTKLAAYNAALAAVATALSDRDTALTALRGGLTQEGAYVENITGGDRVKIESAGMNVRADASPVGAPTQVLNLVVTAGDNDGTLDAAWDPVRGANSYEVQVSVDPVSGTSWAFKMSATRSSATLAGLTSGTKMWSRVRAVGADNTTGPWSDPATKTVP